MISLHRSMHSSQMYTPGPAMSFLTCFWLFPQNEHFSKSPPSPMRAMVVVSYFLFASRSGAGPDATRSFRNGSTDEVNSVGGIRLWHETYPLSALDASTTRSCVPGVSPRLPDRDAATFVRPVAPKACGTRGPCR